MAFDENEIRAEEVVRKFGLKPAAEARKEIKELLEYEVINYKEGSSEYLRVLCGMLFCIGCVEDSALIWKAKMLNFDVGCMIDIEFFFGAGIKETLDYINTREDLERMKQFLSDFAATEDFEKEEFVSDYIDYYENYFSLP